MYAKEKLIRSKIHQQMPQGHQGSKNSYFIHFLSIPSNMLNFYLEPTIPPQTHPVQIKMGEAMDRIERYSSKLNMVLYKRKK